MVTNKTSSERTLPGWNTARKDYTDLDPGEFERLVRLGYRYVELKYDGNFGEIISNERGYWRLYSRSGRVKGHGPGCIPNIHVLGEYLVGTQWAKRSPDFERFKLFEVRRWGASKDVGWNSKAVSAAVKLLQQRNFNWVDPVTLYPISQAPVLWRQYVLGDEQFEGLIFLKDDGSLARMKKQVTMDYVLMGINISTSASYRGEVKSLVGGLFINGKLTQVVNICGLKAHQRKEFYNNRGKLVGKVFEASGKMVFTSGALRSPSFERWREDKKPKECTWTR